MSKSTKSTQTNEPPAWAKPLLQKGASEGMRLYDEKSGYNVYTGPTQAQFSPQTLGGMNRMMAATGGGGAGPITNEGVFNNPQIQQVRQFIEQMQAQQPQQPQQQAAGSGVPGWVETWERSGSPIEKMYAEQWRVKNMNLPAGERSTEQPRIANHWMP
jgi:hypothetical protein